MKKLILASAMLFPLAMAPAFAVHPTADLSTVAGSSVNGGSEAAMTVGRNSSARGTVSTTASVKTVAKPDASKSTGTSVTKVNGTTSGRNSSVTGDGGSNFNAGSVAVQKPASVRNSHHGS